MKIIDLLNKIANDEEVPKYIQYYNMLKGKTDIMMVCEENIFYKLDQLEIQLNSRVEQIEQENKIPERLTDLALTYNNKILVDKINGIIDFLKSKEE